MSNVQTINVGGEQFAVEISLTAHSLIFRTKVGDHDITAYSREALVEQIKRKLVAKKVPLSIPVIFLQTVGGVSQYVRGVLRGQHSKTHDYLVTVFGKKEQVRRIEILAPDDLVTAEQLDELNRLLKAEQDAESAKFKAIRALTKGKYYSPSDMIRNAEQAAFAAEAAKEEQAS